MIYLDHAAATPMKDKVWRAMKPYFSEKFFNPSAPYLPAVEVRADYLTAKSVIAKKIGVKADSLIMTAGATESINLAFSSANNVLISGVEHPAVQAVAQSKSSMQIIPVNSDGLVDVKKIAELITDETDLISVSLAGSDLGTIQPVAEIGRLVKEINLKRQLAGNKTPLLFHSDASQALGYLEVNPARLGLDLLTISATKIGGPKQVGALWAQSAVKLSPILIGGGQELGFRGGTENVAGVIGFAQAVKSLNYGESSKVAKLRNQLESKLLELDDIKVLGHPKKRLPNYLTVTFSNIEAERLIYRLEDKGVLVSTGAACAANRGAGSLALKSIGLTEKEQLASLRLTLGEMTSKEEVAQAGQIIVNEVKLERERLGV